MRRKFSDRRSLGLGVNEIRQKMRIEHLFVLWRWKNTHYQRNCKICNSPFWLYQALLYHYHNDNYSYAQLVEFYKQNHFSLNQYNISVHIHRHVEQKDIEEAEAQKAYFEKMKTEVDAEWLFRKAGIKGFFFLEIISGRTFVGCAKWYGYSYHFLLVLFSVIGKE